jgi:hypothetical protein
LNSVFWTWILKTVIVWLITLRYGVHDAVLYVSDGATKASDVLDIRSARAGPNIVNASKQWLWKGFRMQTEQH